MAPGSVRTPTRPEREHRSGRVTWPDSEYSVKPGDFSVPIDLNQSMPLVRIGGTLAMDSTLLTTVGQA